MGKHTSGEWKIQDDSPTSVWAGGHYIAETYTDGEANARLIAAAPDLLAALKALGPIMADIGYFEGSDHAVVSANADSLGRHVISERQKACNAAWAAIARAEGR